MANYNSDKLIENDYAVYLDEDAKNQALVITNIEKVPNKPADKPTYMITCEITEGIHKGKTVKDFYGDYESMNWKSRMFFCALGMYEYKEKKDKNGNVKRYKHVLDGAEYNRSLINLKFRADCMIEISDVDYSKTYTKIRNERQI